jgi:amidase
VIEPHRLSAREAARRIERGELSAEALVASCLERIREREQDLQAWACIAARPEINATGPLHGVPVGVKDIFDTHDMPSEYGSPVYAGHRPRADAGAVALTRRAGGTILGKTATCEFATFIPAKTRNPHDLSRTPGGSSAGSAAAVADFGVPLAFGTQTAGSIVRPGSYCGVVAYKPTYNSLPRAGMKPSADSLDTVGLFARDVGDVAFFLSALLGRQDLDARIDRPRIGTLQSELIGSLEGTVRKLEAKEVKFAEIENLRRAHATILRYESCRSLADELRRFPEKVHPDLVERCRIGASIDAEEYRAAQDFARRRRATLDELFGERDVLVCAAAPGEAPVGLASTGDPRMNIVWTLLHVPCLSVPAAKGPAGMPVGLQVVGRIGDDARTLACAAYIESVLAR